MNDLWCINLDDINNRSGQAVRIKNLIINLSNYYGISLITSTKLEDMLILKKVKNYYHCNKIRIYSENIKNPKSVLYFFNLINCINRIINDDTPIYTDSHLVTFIIKKFGKKNPVITECHGSNIEELVAKRIFTRHNPFYKIFSYLEKIDWILADGIIANNEQTKKMLVKKNVAPDKIHISYNGVDIKVFSSKIKGNDIRKKIGIKNDFVMLYIGSYRSWHGVENLLKILKKLNEKYRDIKLLLVGDGPERKNIEEKAKLLSINDNTIFIDFISHNEIPKYIAAADICPYFPPAPSQTHTRSFSGTPIKFFEYLAMGKPIITTNQPEFQFIKEKKCGILTNESLNEFIKEIERLYINKNLREELGTNGIEFIQKERSWGKISNDIHQFISKFY